MGAVPKHIARMIDWYLKNQNCITSVAVADAEALRRKAEEQPPRREVAISGKGRHTDEIAARATYMAEAERILKQVPLWKEVVEETRAYCAEGRRLERFFALYYTMGLSFGYVMEEMGVEKTTMYQWRDKIITYAAMLAVDKRLIKMAADATDRKGK